MKKNSNRNFRKNEGNLLYFANVSAKSARLKKMAKEEKENNKK